ncbi:hypothetical protein FACS1894102_7280 [Spirochaetia bacterium]|nr:hypothetical protein FACS1894102_7250 [Spirochaetia bacterium]GHT51355.1 hypothetical protein FACS1894102_7280 [Spirochaetia bacterium]
MPTYTDIQKEETLKGLVYKDFFSEFGYEPNIDNIDFVITENKTRDQDDLFTPDTPYPIAGPNISERFE